MKQVVNKNLAPTPPMGWNSWDCYGLDVNEAEVRANAAFMSEHLKDLGWEYVVVDLGWYAPGVTTQNYKQKNIPLSIDEWGRLMPLEERFPSSANGAGFKPLADYVHSLGLKFGIHIMRGMPWIAAEQACTIKGTSTTCDQISDPTDQCLWYSSMYGINFSKKDAQEYYNSLIELYASWGVDFIKADDMGSWDGDGLNSPYRVDEVEALARAIELHGNTMVLSLSPGAAYIGNAKHLSENAHMWRISADFWDDWEALKRQFARCDAWSRRRIDGHWPDADMLPLGRIGIRGEVGEARETNFTYEEQKTLLTLWSIFRSPLMFGGDFTLSDKKTIELISNKELLKLHREGRKSKQIYRDEKLIIWESFSANKEDYYLAFFNISDKAINVSTSEYDIKSGTEIWMNTPISSVIEIGAHDVALIKVK